MRSYRLHESGFALLTLLAMCASIATPVLRPSVDQGRCHDALHSNAIQVYATGVEEGSDWAIVKLRGLEEVVVTEGEEFHKCFRLVAVREKSVVLSNTLSDERREFFLGGYSTAQVRVVSTKPTTNQDFVESAMERHSVVRESPTVDRIEYPASTNSAHLPKLIFHNKAGSSFYGDYSALGLGERQADESPSDSSSHIQGVRVNEPSQGSLLASLGLKDGQKIVAVNGRFVRTPEEVSRLLEQRDGQPVSLGYYDPESRMILSTHGVVSSM